VAGFPRDRVMDISCGRGMHGRTAIGVIDNHFRVFARAHRAELDALERFGPCVRLASIRCWYYATSQSRGGRPDEGGIADAGGVSGERLRRARE
jgi:hypothetical protein